MSIEKKYVAIRSRIKVEPLHRQCAHCWYAILVDECRKK